MRDQCVTRVLIQLQRVEHALGDQEEHQRHVLDELRADEVPEIASERLARRDFEQFTLGRIEGLVSAQLLVADRRMMYERRARFEVPWRPETSPDLESGDQGGSSGL